MMPATADRPKPMVTVNGKRIIDTLLDALVNVGIKDIVIIRGYKKERFNEILEKYPFVRFIDNDRYDKENNISSVILASKEINNGYLCEADLYITNPEVIRKYQYVSNILGSYSGLKMAIFRNIKRVIPIAIIITVFPTGQRKIVRN